ncbi:hypothetical protein BC834DRAFT_167000 [Gloeopeniophorella convolvens]|nr:hypothetical protein BC834DRAFT_167000 [Gloeopeniophorella convolvens]
MLNQRSGKIPVDGQTGTIDVFPNEVLLEVFDCYRLAVHQGRFWNEPWPWYTLAHVCRRWRQILLGAPERLKLQLRFHQRWKAACRMLRGSPPLPLTIDYQPETEQDGSSPTESGHTPDDFDEFADLDDETWPGKTYGAILGLIHINRAVNILIRPDKGRDPLTRLRSVMRSDDSNAAPKLETLHLESEFDTELPKSFLSEGAPRLQ